MALRRILLSMWKSLFQRSRLDRELDDELRDYLEGLIQKGIKAGQDPAAARRAAMIEMGGVTQVKAAVQRGRYGAGIDAVWQDVRFTLKSLIRKPAFAIVAILTFALGVGANTAIFSVVNTVLIQPLPYKNPSELVLVWRDMTASGFPRAPLSGGELRDLRERAMLFAAFEGIWPNTAHIAGDNHPEQLRIGSITANFFNVLGTPALIGRTFNEADEARGAPPTIILSWAVWQRRYGGDASVIGRTALVNGKSTEIVGVMPEDFRLLLPADAGVPDDLEAYLPFNGPVTATRARTPRYLRVIGRMKPGIPFSQANDEMAKIAQSVAREYTQYGATTRIFTLGALHAEGTENIRAGLLALLAGVALLLLTACLNVGSLLIARAAARTKETALRLAIGANYGQIIRQCLVEGLILALIGGVVGVIFGEISLRGLVALRSGMTRVGSAEIDTTVLLFTSGVALFWGVLFSFAPMIEVLRTDTIGGLLGHTKRIGPIRQRTRSVLVVFQIAFGVVLLVGAGLMIRTFISLRQVDAGYKTDQILSFRVNAPGYDSGEALNDFHRRLQVELAALPGVTGVGSVSHAPFDNIPNWGGPYYLTADADPMAPFADFRAVSPGYLEVIGAQLIEGRFFTEADGPTSQGVAIVDDVIAKRSWPGDTAVGKRISVDPEFFGRRWATVVGVVRHMRVRSLVEDLSPQIYFPIRQSTRPTTYAVKTSGDPAALAGITRDVIRKLNPNAPIYDLRLMEDYLVVARSVQRFTMVLAAAFAGIALALAFVGVFGLVSYSVNSRRYEFGVRLALGARSIQIVNLVMRQAVLLVSAGVAIGIGGAVLVGRLLQAQLFGVTPLDIPTYLVAVAVIAGAGFLVSWFPARRASLSSPLDVIRAE